MGYTYLHIFNIIDVFVTSILSLIVIVFYKKINEETLIFKTNVFLFMLIPLISSLAAHWFHHQPLTFSILAVFKEDFYWLLYFVLHIFKIRPSQVIKLMIFVGLVWAGLTIGQQFTYPYYFFYRREDDFRAGVIRFMLDRHHYGIFLVLYYYNRFLNTQKIKHLLWVFIGLVAFYYFGARQYGVGVFICLFLSMFIVKGRGRNYAITFSLLFVIAFFVLKNTLFAEYVSMTSEQLNDHDDIRRLSANFFLFDYWPNWLTRIIGNGREGWGSSYTAEIVSLMQDMGFYRTDVGIIGTYNLFGVFYVINNLWTHIKGLKIRNLRNNSYLILFFVHSFMLLLLTDFFADVTAIPFYCFIFYLIDKYNEIDPTEEVSEASQKQFAVVSKEYQPAI